VDNKVGLFVTGTDHALYQYNAASKSWQNLGGYLTSSPAATSTASGVIDVGARGGDGTLWMRHYAGSWGPWTKVGGQLLGGTGPAAYAKDNTVGWFVIGTNNQLYHKTSSTVWENLGGYLTSSPAATSPSSGIIDVGARGNDGALWTRSYTS
jgi:hypothetical protein